MRLLDTETGQFVEKDPERTRYAILSHTWDTEKPEQTYEQLREIQQRYDPKQRRRIDSEGSAPSSPDLPHDQRKSSSQPPSPHSPSDSPSSTTPLPEALGRFTQSEVEALLRLFGEVYGLTSPAAKPPSSHHPVPTTKHRWEGHPPSIWNDPDLSPKIRDACVVARKNGYRYIWIDSCCIDKSSSSELSEAINSMYKWYALADVCYAYLADVPPGDDHHVVGSYFRKSRWFTRGWTLQELIAPINVVFLSKDWAPIGSKHALDSLVENITKISCRALLHLDPLDKFSVAQRMSWAAKRRTTRVEDRAYSLLGMFNIHMPTLYGEGDHAFHRLQEQIMQRIPDQSLFAWEDVYVPDLRLLENPSPQKTSSHLRLDPKAYHLLPDISTGSKGIAEVSSRSNSQPLFTMRSSIPPLHTAFARSFG